MSVGLLTDEITNKSEKSNLINTHAPSREPVPLTRNIQPLNYTALNKTELPNHWT